MGGRHASRPKKTSTNKSSSALRYADDGEVYGRCKDKLGCGRFVLQIPDGSEVVGKIVGSLYKRAWVNKHDLVLLSRRPLPGPSGDAYDVVHKYSSDEERLLARYGELRDWKTGDSEDSGDNDCVTFEEAEDVDIDTM